MITDFAIIVVKNVVVTTVKNVVIKKDMGEKYMSKTKVEVVFIFETKEGLTEDVVKSIDYQINTDLNEYWQNEDDIAQMKIVIIEKMQDISEEEYNRIKEAEYDG